MSLRFDPIIPPEFYVTRVAYRTRGEVEDNCKRVTRVRSTRKGVLISDGDLEAWLPKKALVATSEPDILALRGWYRPSGTAAVILP